MSLHGREQPQLKERNWWKLNMKKTISQHKRKKTLLQNWRGRGSIVYRVRRRKVRRSAQDASRCKQTEHMAVAQLCPKKTENNVKKVSIEKDYEGSNQLRREPNGKWGRGEISCCETIKQEECAIGASWWQWGVCSWQRIWCYHFANHDVNQRHEKSGLV